MAAFAKLTCGRTFALAEMAFGSGFDSGLGEVGVDGTAAADIAGDDGVSRGPPRWDA